MNMRLFGLLPRFYYLNPRWLYLAVTIVLIIPLCVTIAIPKLKASVGPRGLYEMAGQCPDDKVILIDSSWDLGSKPECMAQLECFVKDLCKRKKKFVVLSTALYAPTFAQQVILPIVEAAKEKYGKEYVYGEDWVNLGFIKPPADNQGLLIDAFCRDIHKTRDVDINRQKIAELPLMQKVRNAGDLHMVFAINYAPPQEWMSFGKSQHGLQVAFGSASIMGPYYLNFLDSGQLGGLLAGNRGACEYESLTGIPGLGSKVMMSFAFGVCLIISAVILGNAGYWASRRQRSAA